MAFCPGLIGRYGRVRVLRSSAAIALAGLLLIDFGIVLPVAVTGAALMGLGTALGFPSEPYKQVWRGIARR
jgi:hypothetical protein